MSTVNKSSTQPTNQCKPSMDPIDMGRIFTIDQASGGRLSCIKTDFVTSVCTPSDKIESTLKAHGGIWCKEKDGVRVCSLLQDHCENMPWSM
jgi:hypothetical protein